jgi:hypothetical protein
MIQLTDREKCLIALGATQALPRLRCEFLNLIMNKIDPEIAFNTFFDAVHNVLEDALNEYLENEENTKDWDLTADHTDSPEDN